MDHDSNSSGHTVALVRPERARASIHARRARELQPLDGLAANYIGPSYCTSLFWQLIRTPAEKRDVSPIQSAKDKTTKAWKLLDNHLARNAYVAGNVFTIGDIPLGIWAYRWLNLPIERQGSPT